MAHFNRIGLVARSGSELVADSLRQVASFLGEQQVDVIVEPDTGEILADPVLQRCTLTQMGEQADLVIAVGGDGNILGAARALAPFGVPLLGINRGRLGFLADVSPEEIELRVGEVLAGQYSIEEHFLLEGELGDGEEKPCALNEVIVHSAAMPKMIEFSLFVNDAFVYKQFSDGLIVSSPTGSTAYALSAGGPIMHPSLDAIVLIPMFPHSLNSRPLVVPGDSELRIEMGATYGGQTRVSFDSQLEFQMAPGQSVSIRKQQAKLKLLHPPGHSFYEVCRSKLDWATRFGD